MLELEEKEDEMENELSKCQYSFTTMREELDEKILHLL